MEEQIIYGVSFVVIVGLNLLAATLVWAEYSANQEQYLHSIAIGQSAALVWQLITVWLTYISAHPLGLYLSSAAIFVSGLYYLSASLYDKGFESRQLTHISVLASAGFVTAYFLPPAALDWSWILVALVLFTAPIATLLYFKPGARWLIALLQLLIAACIIAGVNLLNTPNELTGGVLYFTGSILVPILAITYVIFSIKQSRVDLSEKERNYRVFFDALNEVFFQLDLDGIITNSSPSISQFGKSVDEFVGTEVTNYLFDPDSFREKLKVARTRKESFSYSGSFRSGSSFIECEIRCSPILDNDSEVVHFAGAIRNTHERTMLEQQFIEAERHRSLGVLAGGIAHDFNNYLQGIVGHTEVLLSAPQLERKIQEKSLNSILNAATSAGSLCRQLLQYTGKGAAGKTELDLGTTIVEVIDIVNPSHLENIKIDVDIAEESAPVYGDKSQISQVFLNLIRNALDAVHSEGSVSISLKRIHVSENSNQELQLLGNIKAGDYFRIAIKDDGPGIPEEIQTQIFEPFFSTKPQGHGLGLAAVLGILNTHQGEIILNSKNGEGTEFKVYLPVFQSEQSFQEEIQLHANSNSKFILLVDDDSEILKSTSEILEHAGNRVIVAKDGSAAIDAYKNSKEDFNILITDIKMPKMDGVTLARKLREQEPTLPVILTTGYDDVSDKLTSTETLGYEFIRKPYRADEILKAIDHLSGRS